MGADGEYGLADGSSNSLQGDFNPLQEVTSTILASRLI